MWLLLFVIAIALLGSLPIAAAPSEFTGRHCPITEMTPCQ